mmetsp:Transcript_32631/g.72081  ORF Transcript_32631/g.72081 Transcript_32631/m.72081 type:complete len:202 (+) Transcript_32631:1986-2591(+)
MAPEDLHRVPGGPAGGPASQFQCLVTGCCWPRQNFCAGAAGGCSAAELCTSGAVHERGGEACAGAAGCPVCPAGAALQHIRLSTSGPAGDSPGAHCLPDYPRRPAAAAAAAGPRGAPGATHSFVKGYGGGGRSDAVWALWCGTVETSTSRGACSSTAAARLLGGAAGCCGGSEGDGGGPAIPPALPSSPNGAGGAQQSSGR